MPARNNHASSLLLIGLLLCSIAPFALTSKAQENPTAAEIVTDYLGQDVFLRPGVGLKKVRIGMDFKQILQAWGRPTIVEKNDIGGTRWTYQIADHTRITLLGGNKVGTITIAGEFNSPYVTTEGAGFGMARHQIASIYGPSDTDSDEIDYDNRGIGFVLERGQVSEMKVFSPK